MLVGRAAELETAVEHLAARLPLLVVGEPGIGKTTLLRAAAAADGRRVHEGGGLRALTWASYLAVERACDTRFLAGDAVAVAADVVRRVGDGILLVDDLHWADSETLGLLPLLAGQIPILSSLRSGDPASTAAHEAAERAGFDTLRLEPLDTEAAEAIVRRCSPGLARRAVAAIVEAAAGNPLLIEELSSAPSSSPTLDRAIRMRLRGCTRDVRHSLALLSLAGDAVSADLLGGARDELLDTGLVVSDGARCRLRHALIGEACAGALAPDERRRLHALLARNAASPGEAARHHWAARELREAQARALEAAEASATPGERARHLRVAAECAPRGDTTGDALRLRAASALLDAGEYEHARRLARSVESADPETQATVALYLGAAAFAEGRRDEAGAFLEEGLALVRGTESRVEALLTAETCELLIWDWDAAGAVARAREALALAERAGLDDPRFRCRLGRALYIAESTECIEELTEALEHARRVGDASAECEAGTGLAAAYHYSGDARSARAVVHAMIDRAEALRLRGAALPFRFMAAFHGLAHDGAADEAIAELTQLLREPGLGPLRDEVVAYLGLALAHLGRVDDAVAVLDGAVEAARSEWGRALTLYVRSEVEWTAGRVDEGLAAATACAASLVTPLVPWAEMMRGWLGAVPASVEGGGSTARIVRGAVTAVRALQRRAEPDRANEAEQLFLDAADQFAGVAVHEELRCLWAAGDAARQAGDLDRAVERLCAVERRASAYAFLPLVNRVQQSLRRAGVRRAARRAPAVGGLTPRERDVLALVARGRTSPEIARVLGLTVGTVDVEIRAAMTKLGAATRIQAALLASQSGVGRESVRRPLIVVWTANELERACAELEEQGWRIRFGWSPAGDGRVALAGLVASAEDATAAVLAATRGVGLVAHLDAGPDVADAFLDDLHRIGRVDEREPGFVPAEPRLRTDQRNLLRLIAEGCSVAEAAAELHLSRRTAERRLAAARAELGVATTAEAALAVAAVAATR